MSRSFASALLLATSASLAAGPPAPEPGDCGGSHIVVRGDTLYSIARRCHSTVVGIAQASGLADPRRIEIGQRLIIPGQDAPAPGKEEPGETLIYAFQPGDTLFSLARWAHVGVPALIAANPGINPHKVEIGDTVRLPAGAMPPGPARYRERGNGPGPAFARDQVPIRTSPTPPPRAAPDRVRERGAAPAPAIVRQHHSPPPSPQVPPPPRHPKPDSEDERAPEGM